VSDPTPGLQDHQSREDPQLLLDQLQVTVAPDILWQNNSIKSNFIITNTSAPHPTTNTMMTSTQP